MANTYHQTPLTAGLDDMLDLRVLKEFLPKAVLSAAAAVFPLAGSGLIGCI